jgi:hypothetical protein
VTFEWAKGAIFAIPLNWKKYNALLVVDVNPHGA